MEFFGVNPGRRIAGYFLGAIAVGTILLLLPISAGNESVSFIDAMFTATSAVCVTGLTTLDTGTGFSLFGQIVILILIQLGGLGIMTFATALFASFGSKLSFGDRLGLSQSFLAGHGGRSTSLLKAIILTTFSLEFLGAVALFMRFQSQYPKGKAIYYAIFHSVSAFCNAGFSTFSNSLENYQGDIPVILVFSILIICGGLGFVVIRELLDKAGNRKVKLSLHSKLCLSGTAALLVLGTLAFLIAEHQNAFRHIGFFKSLANALFQSVTSRTAGFNTISQPGLTEVSLMLTMVLMFIGACPGSTGGGIKVTTILVILILVYNRFKGENFITAFKRTISNESLIRALTVFILAILVIIALLAFFMFAEEKPVSHIISHGWLGESLFEVLSAFGTVGLSLGMTTHLHWLGKFILIITMFAGRVGLLTLAYALARPPKQGEIVYAEESVMTG
jgi:trk system potassium uptake protein TrkH